MYVLTRGMNRGNNCPIKPRNGNLCSKHKNLRQQSISKPEIDYKLGNNETLGITCEYLLCKMNNIDASILEPRVRNTRQIESLEKALFQINDRLNITEWVGAKNTSIDFICNDKTLSVKTNYSKNGKVCPQTIGQPTPKSFVNHMNGYGYNIISTNFTDLKKFIVDNISTLPKLYYQNLFSCDYTVWAYQTGDKFETKILDKNIRYPFEDISKLKLLHHNESWNGRNSNQLYYGNIKIGEFQIHTKSRQNIKFRFYLNNLLSIIKSN